MLGTQRHPCRLRVIPIFALLLVGPAVCTGATAQDTSSAPADATETPQILVPYEPIADAAAAYHAVAVSPEGWQTAYEFTVGGEVPEGVQPVNAEIRQRAVDGAGVMELTTESGGFAQVGEPVSGPMIIEIEARSISERQCDLSLILGGITRGPGFQFGANWNTRNLVWTGPHTGRPAFDSVELPGEKRIIPNRWHTVRMVVHRDPEPRIVASVDGEVQGTIPLEEDYDWSEPRQPMIYAYDSTIQVRRLVIHQPDASDTQAEAESEDAWREHFGDRTAEQVAETAQALIDLLDHDQYAVREGAQRMLGRMRNLALPTLRDAWDQASPEQRWRLASLMNRMGVRVDELDASASGTSGDESD